MGFISSIKRQENLKLAAAKAEVRGMERSTDPIREHTSDAVQSRIDTQTQANIRYYAYKSNDDLTLRIGELDQEWTLDRALMAVAAGATLSGLALNRLAGLKWLLLPAVAGVFLLEHVLDGWFVSASLFRKLGFRSDREVQHEKYMLRILRGDFTIISEGTERATREKLILEVLRAAN